MKEKTFEKSIEELENIVKALEDRTVSLEESLKLYEQGIILIKNCSTTLEEAKQKVKILSIDKNGGAEEKDFDK